MSIASLASVNSLTASVPAPLARVLQPVFGLSISVKLLAGFSTIALAAILVGVTGLYSIDKINGTLNNITDVAAPTVETSDDLIALIFEANKVAEEIIADEDLDDLPPLIDELKILEAAFERTYIDLQALVTDESLLDELETARTEQTEFNAHALEMIREHRRTLELEAEAFQLLEGFDRVGSTLTGALDEFAVENETEMAKAEEEGDRLEQLNSDAATINRVLGQLFDVDYPVVEAALKLQRLIIEMQDTAGEYLAERRSEDLAVVERNFLDLHQESKPHLDVLANLAESSEDLADAKRFQKMLTTWVGLADGRGQLFDTHRRMLEAEEHADQLVERLEEDADNVVEALDQVAETADAISDGADEAAGQAVTQAQTAILLLLVVALVVSLALLGLIVVTVVRPVTALTHDMVTMSEDYGPAMQPTVQPGDEVGRLRAAFDYLEGQVQARTADLQQRTRELDSANLDLEKELRRRHLLEQQLVHAQKLEGLGILAGGIAHDFNNMLYVILGCSKMALEELKDRPQTSELVAKIDKAAQRSKSIVNQVLFFSRQGNPDRKPLDLCRVFHESITLLRAGLPSTIILEVEVEEGCGIILADETQIQQLIVNLATNASQAYEDNKGSIELGLAQVEVDQAFASRHLGLKAGPYAKLSVTDRGSGIPAEILPKIYDPFFTTKPVGEGTGLGLAVVHGIVTSHDGVVVISTAIDEGTTFEVFLPIADESVPADATGELPHDVSILES